MFAMSTARKLIGILTAAATLSCCAETNDLEKAIALFFFYSGSAFSKVVVVLVEVLLMLSVVFLVRRSRCCY
jgi:ACR3 family arsenite efflux pump ArsB